MYRTRTREVRYMNGVALTEMRLPQRKKRPKTMTGYDGILQRRNASSCSTGVYPVLNMHMAVFILTTKGHCLELILPLPRQHWNETADAVKMTSPQEMIPRARLLVRQQAVLSISSSAQESDTGGEASFFNAKRRMNELGTFTTIHYTKYRVSVNELMTAAELNYIKTTERSLGGSSTKRHASIQSTQPRRFQQKHTSNFCCNN